MLSGIYLVNYVTYFFNREYIQSNSSVPAFVSRILTNNPQLRAYPPTKLSTWA